MDNPFKASENYSRAAFLTAAVFSFIGIAVLAFTDQYLTIEGTRSQFIVASFGSTAVLIYAAPKAPFSKPKNVFFGHVFSAAVSLAIVTLFSYAGVLGGCHWIVCGLCVSVSIVLMMCTGTVHPPAGATALTVAISQITDWQFMIFPLIPGLLAMMAVAYAASYCREKIE